MACSAVERTPRSREFAPALRFVEPNTSDWTESVIASSVSANRATASGVIR